MPIELDTYDASHTVNVHPGTNEATALCFLYVNSDYGFKPAEVREHTSLPNNSTYKALTRLHEKDLIGKTSDGYYHALNDQHVAQYVESLQNGEEFQMNTGTEDYPEDISDTSTGSPSDDEELKLEADRSNEGKSPIRTYSGWTQLFCNIQEDNKPLRVVRVTL